MIEHIGHITLRDLVNKIKTTLSALSQDFYVVAEISEANLNRSGHFYLGLVEKENDTIVAQLRGVIWKNRYEKIISKFAEETGVRLEKGIKILMVGNVRYHEVYGLAFDIKDIVPSFTIGDMARKRKEVLDRLTREGLIDSNKRKRLPLVIQSIAVVSSDTAAGYGDFLHILENNPYGYKFSIELFQSYMQGEMAEESILQALRDCKDRIEEFDVLVIIRGGGSQTDIHCFDSYILGKEIALFPIPVLSGIGHERDETVIDRVSHKRLITPSAVANFIISRAKGFEDSLDNLSGRLARQVQILISHEKELLAVRTSNFVSLTDRFIDSSKGKLRTLVNFLQTNTVAYVRSPLVNLRGYEERLRENCKKMIRTQTNRLNTYLKALKIHPLHILRRETDMLKTYEAKARLLDPANTLKRGYSITMLRGKVLKSVDSVQKGDIIDTILHKGTIKSRIEQLKEGERE